MGVEEEIWKYHRESKWEEERKKLKPTQNVYSILPKEKKICAEIVI